ncbi:MAG: DUF4345 domain-containing protein [Myxococcales bacterium]|nr:DUF4345 domain-containing protein [Myxococcales bacterium]
MAESEPTSGTPRVVLLALAAGFIAFGVAFLLAPQKLAAYADVSTTSRLGLVELRAFYGGVQLGLGVFLAVTAMRREWQLPGLLCALLSLLGVFGARIYALTAEGWPGAMVLVFLAIELAGVVAAGFGLMKIKQGQGEAQSDEGALLSKAEKTLLIEKTQPIERTLPMDATKRSKL